MTDYSDEGPDGPMIDGATWCSAMIIFITTIICLCKGWINF